MDLFARYQVAITAAQTAFSGVVGAHTDEHIFTLKDAVFDALSDFSQAVDDADLKQVLARAAIEVHLFPVGQEHWREELIDKIGSAINTGFHVSSFMEHEIEINDPVAMAA